MSNTYEAIKERILNNTDTVLSKIEGSTLNTTVSGIAEEMAKGYLNMEDIPKLVFIEDTFFDFLDKRVNEFGVYRKQGTKAVGELNAVGEEGVIISNGTMVTFENLMYVVLNDVVLPSTEKVVIEALEIGYQYKQKKGTQFTPLEAIEGLTSLTASADFIKGTDIETDEELFERFQKVVSNPSTSGNIHHYEQWALGCEGVGRAKVYPLWNGNGTVKVMIIGNDGKPVDSSLIQTCKEYIEQEMPIGCQLTVITPTLLQISITAKIELTQGFTIEEVNQEFKLLLDDYLKSVNDEFVYSKVYGILAKLQGVADLTELKLNGSTTNIQISEDKIANIQSVEVSEVI